MMSLGHLELSKEDNTLYNACYSSDYFPLIFYCLVYNMTSQTGLERLWKHGNYKLLKRT